MRMVKCFKGHIYNAEKFNTCPHCANMEAGKKVADPLGEKQQEQDTEEPHTVKQRNYEIIGRRKVVGCLLCVKGTLMGEGFFLVEGYNHIGRSANLEVVLSGETTVSRMSHACICYEWRQNRYELTVAEGKEDVFYNGKLVEHPVSIESGGTIQIGQCSLRFIAFCGENFMWNWQ